MIRVSPAGLVFGLSLFSMLWTGCALLSVSNGYVQGSMQDNLPTVQVTNHGLDVVKVYDAYGKLATVMPEEVRCVRMQRSYETSTQLYLNTLGDSATTPQFFPTDSNGWQIEIGSMPLRFSAISIQPLDPPCVPNK